MVRLSRSQIQPIGLDLGMDAVKMIQLEVVDNALSVIAAAKQAIPPEARDQSELRLPVAMDIVRQMLRSGQFQGRHVITALPREIVQAKNLRLPVMPAADLESAVAFEAKNLFPSDSDIVVRHLSAGEVRQGHDTKLEVIALAVHQQEIDGYLEQLHRAGCEVDSLDFEPCGLYRSIERFIRRREDELDVHVMIDLGMRQTQVVIGKGRDISFYKSIDIGLRRVHQDVSRKLGISEEEARGLRRRQIEAALQGGTAADDPVRQAVCDATRSTIEELAREISLCLRYYSVTFRGQRPGKVRLVGGESADPQVLSILGSALPIPVEAGKPLFSVNTTNMKQPDRRGHMGEWAVALGLALKATTTYFGARDGRRRDAAKTAPTASEVEAIDFGEGTDIQLPPMTARASTEAANA